MPPHQTHSTIDAGHVSGLNVDLSIASATGAISSVQPSTQSDASIAALREVLSEKDAAGPPATPTWLIIRLIGRCWRAIQARQRREYVRASLSELSERELTDIGITRAEIEHIAALQTLESLRHDPRYVGLVSRRGV
ncbi:conserved protein of unknown function [Bradyrhizobium sp. ORS 285]|uniref:DUF1127 domain-containing protein n=1 Tax=Bradyrhizobium sp. ORS 285 TaxID=115808 RepID=UPI000240AB84|nr:DUF1127 domain-containing protein [Bradyrhizobium sp. ORS 285]CCD85904.1 conserved hypothetical protein [Bradyrhizobium sp. ORS 285]SMX59172.1 conserved protein of unknown function [Bradyrhizobium sp. ORS 285]